MSPNKKVTKEVGTGGGFSQSHPLLCTTPPNQATPEDMYTKGENVPIFAHPSSDIFHFKQKRRDTFCLNGRYSKVLGSSPVRTGDS